MPLALSQCSIERRAIFLEAQATQQGSASLVLKKKAKGETPVQSDYSPASSGLETKLELEQEDDLEVKPLEQKTDEETWQIQVYNKGCKHRLSVDEGVWG